MILRIPEPGELVSDWEGQACWGHVQSNEKPTIELVCKEKTNKGKWAVGSEKRQHEIEGAVVTGGEATSHQPASKPWHVTPFQHRAPLLVILYAIEFYGILFTWLSLSRFICLEFL